MKMEKEAARLWYINEAVKENWSTRVLERQINSFLLRTSALQFGKETGCIRGKG
jgi:predicted nuclease of restriction endonuclease-like (RecB) superfamily